MRRTPSITKAAMLAVLLVVTAVGCRSRDDHDSAPNGAGTVPSAVGTPVTGSSVTTTAAPPVKPAVTANGKTTDVTTHTADGRERTYHVYVPASIPADEPVPLLVALHGGGGWGAQFETNSGFDDLAEANGFIVVYPDGISIPITPRSRVWNGGACCGPAALDKQNVDDVAFISAVIEEVEAAHAIDRDRVFASGHSNGAIMSYRLACELSDKIAAIGVQAGTLEIDQCHPSQKVAVLEIHGTADQNIPISGGAGDRSLSQTDFRPPLDTLKTFVAADGCPSDPTESVDPTNADVTVQTWAPCANGTTVQWVKVTGANHAWMGHPASSGLAERMVGEPYQALDSSLTIWAFLAAHPRQ